MGPYAVNHDGTTNATPLVSTAPVPAAPGAVGTVNNNTAAPVATAETAAGIAVSNAAKGRRLNPSAWFDACADNSHVVHAVEAAVTELLEHGMTMRAAQAGMITRFDASKAPTISVRQYLERITKYAPCSSQCYTAALIYIARLCELHPDFVVTPINVHRLLITSIMLAVKFYDDFYYNNAYFARVGGVRPAELNSLELEFLTMVKYDLHVHQEAFVRAWGHLKPKSLCTAQCAQAELFTRHARELNLNPLDLSELTTPPMDLHHEPSFVMYLPQSRKCGVDEEPVPTSDLVYPSTYEYSNQCAGRMDGIIMGSVRNEPR